MAITGYDWHKLSISTPLVTNLMNFSLNGTVSTNKVLWIEVIGDGYSDGNVQKPLRGLTGRQTQALVT